MPGSGFLDYGKKALGRATSTWHPSRWTSRYKLTRLSPLGSDIAAWLRYHHLATRFVRDAAGLSCTRFAMGSGAAKASEVG